MNAGKKDGISNGSIKEGEHILSREQQHEENERKARVDSVWEKMNSGLPAKIPQNLMNKNKATSARSKSTPKATPDWMVNLGLVPKKAESASKQDGTPEEAKRLAAAALSAVKDVTSTTTATRGKVEITEVRDFAGEEIEVKKTVDADSSEASEKGGGPPSALDTILEQIKKKPKLSILDKTKMDWGGFKEENRGVEEELDAYKKSSNQYLDKVSFLNRADLREFERERDARLASQAKRRSEMRDGDL